MEIVHIIIGIAALIGIVIYFIVKAEKKRIEKIKRVSLLLGFSFSAKPEKIKLKFKVFNKGHSKKYSNLLKGSKNGISWEIFEYRYIVGAGKSQHTYNQTIALAELNINLPKFSLGPEYFFHRFGNMFGKNDIDFDNSPVFSKNYLLKGTNEKKIRSLFTTEMINYFEKQKKGICIETDNKQMIIYRSAKRVKPDNIKHFLEEATEIVKLFVKEEF